MNERAIVPTPENTGLLDAEDFEVEKGIRTWNSMRALNIALSREVEQLKEEKVKLQAANFEMDSTIKALRVDAEFYRVLAIESKTHLHIVQGHVNAACNKVKDLSATRGRDD
jgi:hypothetical protein